MATCPSQFDSPFDMLVPSDDVALTAAPSSHSRAGGRDAAQAAMEIGGRAAWLAWQIEADEVLVSEAQSQLRGIGENLGRFGDRLPSDLRGRMADHLNLARGAASGGDLRAVAQAARALREVAERFRNTTMA